MKTFLKHPCFEFPFSQGFLNKTLKGCYITPIIRVDEEKKGLNHFRGYNFPHSTPSAGHIDILRKICKKLIIF